MRARHFLDQAVGAQEAELSGHLSGLPARCLGVGSLEGALLMAQVAVT